jgi:hypothetical protein
MKISYDKIPSGHLHPLAREGVEKIRDALSSEVVHVIREIRFAYNGKTTQEARVVKRGKLYEIRLNFCLTDTGGCLRSRMLSDEEGYLDEIRKHGGRPDPSTKVIDWDMEHAKRYACYVLLHEIGHVIYLERYAGSRPVGKAQAREEKWCDSFSATLLKRLVPQGLCLGLR